MSVIERLPTHELPADVGAESANDSDVASGTGVVELAHVSGATAVVRRLARSPFKLLTPRRTGHCAHVVTSTYGGGLLAGDAISLRLRAGPHTRCAVGTQASTKVYAGDANRRSRQSLEADVGDGAVLAVAPDPVTCFAGASYTQRQCFRLASGASLLLIDWLTSGRAARGERWTFASYRSETRIDVDGRTIARDALLLEGAGGSAARHLGRFDCLATVFLLGPAFGDASRSLLDRVGRMPVTRRAPLVASASPLAAGGAVLRAAGGAAEAVGQFIAGMLDPAWAALGEDPWSRKW